MLRSNFFGNPLIDELLTMQRAMNRLLANEANDTLHQLGVFCQTFPPMNLLETGDGYQLECQLPGYSMEDIELTVQDDTLTIKGSNNNQKPEDASTHRQERRYGNFNRSITLPGSVDVEAITAKLSNGLLLVNLPKSAAAKPRQIVING